MKLVIAHNNYVRAFAMEKSFATIIVLSLAQLLYYCYAQVNVEYQQISTAAGPARLVSRPTINRDARNAASLDIVSMDDLLHTLHYTLHNEIPSSCPIQGPQLDALQKYLQAVSDYFPRDPGTVGAYFRGLRRWVLSKTKIEVTDYRATLERLDRYLSPWHRVDLTQWDDCKGTLTGLRGYPCGLWRLFHSLSLNAIIQRPFEGPIEGIHAYVKEFFQCSQCREHFLHMADRDNILAHVKSARTQALWLWKAHNEVNMKIKGDETEDPGHPKDYYPSKKNCPECFDASDNYVERKVLSYLMRAYLRPMSASTRRFYETRVDLVMSGGRFYLNPRRPRNDYSNPK